jgi:ribosome-binding factor A
MANVSPRLQRVADQIQRELALLIQLEVNDPRVGMVSVTGVKVSRDLAHADVYVTVMGSVDGVSGLAPGVTLDKAGALDKLEVEESLKALNVVWVWLTKRVVSWLRLPGCCVDTNK